MSTIPEQLAESVAQQPLLLLGITAAALIIAVTMARRARKRRLAAEELSTFEPAREKASEGLPRRKRVDRAAWGCVLGPALFLVVGLGFLAIFAFPASKVIQARSWRPLDCEILASSVAAHSGDDGYTYSVEVTYRYTFDGVEYTGSRYKFLGGSSSGHEGKQKVVDSLPPGHVTSCWVDPSDPTEAVLDRGLSWEYAFAILPLVFVTVGAVGLILALRALSAAKNPEVTVEKSFQTAFESLGGAGEARGLADPAPGELILEPEHTPGVKLGCMIFVALFWNGIVGVFVWQFIKSPDLFTGCFLIPFVIIGLLLLVGIPYQMLAMANPRPRLRLADGRLRPGGSTNLYWSFTGAARRLHSLKIDLEGREKATYRSGDSNSTSSATFARVPLVDLQQRDLIGEGSTQVNIPADAMHSFRANRNELAWFVVLHGKIRRWPDVGAEFEVEVLPELAR